MLPVMTAAVSGALAYQAAVDEIAHNLTNLSTPAFRPTRLTQVEASPAAGVIPAVRRRLTRHGPFTETGTPLDVALANDRTFLRVRLPDGSFAYTRRGDLRFDGTGRLVTFGGLPLDPEIRMPADTRVEIRPNGTVVAADDGTETVVGRLELFTFDRPENLEPIGGGLFRESAASGPARPGGFPEEAILPGYLETSGVELVGEFTRLIAAQRAYILNLNVIRDQDQLLSQAIELARG